MPSNFNEEIRKLCAIVEAHGRIFRIGMVQNVACMKRRFASKRRELSLNPAVKLFESGKDRAEKGEDGLRLSYVVPKIW